MGMEKMMKRLLAGQEQMLAKLDADRKTDEDFRAKLEASRRANREALQETMAKGRQNGGQ
jgi:hypothetical protein